jgi:hypothetical protein
MTLAVFRYSPRLSIITAAIALLLPPAFHAAAAQDYAKYSPDALEK